MRCEGLLTRPWRLKNEEIVKELLTERPNMFDNTIQDQPEEWTFGIWWRVYSLSNSSSGLASWNNNYVDGKFTHVVNSKDGITVSNCRDARNHRLLEFIVPIIQLDKPTRVTITIGNTIFGPLDGSCPVEWRVVFRDLAQRLVVGIGKPKSIPISLFLLYLYHSKDILTEQEEIDYEAAKEFISYRITPNPESQSNPVSEGEGQGSRNLDAPIGAL